MLKKEEMLKAEVTERFIGKVEDILDFMNSLVVSEKNEQVFTKNERYRNLVPYLYE